MRMVGCVSLLEHCRNVDILEEANVEPIAVVMRTLEWFGYIITGDKTDNMRAVAEMKMEGKRSRGRPRLRWRDTLIRDMKAWTIRD